MIRLIKISAFSNPSPDFTILTHFIRIAGSPTRSSLRICSHVNNGQFGYFCTKPRKGILRNEKYIISNIFKPFSGS